MPSVSDKWKILTGYKRVEAIQQYLVSQESSRVRNKDPSDTGRDIRVIWNGAEREDHRNVGANPGSGWFTLNMTLLEPDTTISPPLGECDACEIKPDVPEKV